jgi:hypothetical protein
MTSAQIEADLTGVHLTGVQAGHACGPWQLVMPISHRLRQQHPEFFTEAIGSLLEKLVTVTAASLAAGIRQLSGSRQYVPRPGCCYHARYRRWSRFDTKNVGVQPNS